MPSPFTRRKLLESSCVASAAFCTRAAIGPRKLLAAQKPPSPIETGIATICCDGFGDEDFRFAFDAIPKLGLKNVEFNCWYARNLTPSGLNSIKKRSSATGLRPISIQASSFRGGTNHDVAREVSRLLWLMEACDRLGCRIIKCTGSKRDTNGGIESLVDVLKAIVPIAEKKHIKVVLENHHRNLIEFPDDYRFVFDRIDSRMIGMCLDMGHFARSGVDMGPLIDEMHKRILHIDVKDADAVNGKKFVRFGTGIVDCEGVIQQCVDRGYNGYLVLELSLIDRKTMLDDLRQGIAITRPFERSA